MVANPGPRPYSFPVAEFLPGATFMRLRGSSRQDPRANDGRKVGAALEFPAKGAAFLVRTGG